ncbi:MAG: lipoprotein insertase outer membrane protein LolB [Paucibacter sp.]|nr:lipoprotein insertase outer membrane protein LolB [Roseateles sp.]
MTRALPGRRAGMAGALALALLPILSGCASLAPQAAPAALLNAPDAAHLTGRLSVQVTGANGRPSGGNVSFDISGGPAAGQLELSTPLGALVARARWGGGEVSLQTPEGERRFEDLDALTREMLGEAIPLAALFDWLRGQPWPQAAHEPLPAPQSGFEQLGWRLDLARRADGLIIASRNGEPSVTLRARLDASN